MAHGYESNTLSDEAYGDMMTEERPKQNNIDDTSYNKYIGAEVIINVTGEVPRWATVRRCVEDLDRTKVVMYHSNPLMYTWEYELEYDNKTHDRYFS